MYNAIATEPFFVLRLVVSLRLAYDFMNRITSQRHGANVNNKSGGEYVYYSGTNKLKSVANGMGGTTADKRDMSASDNFEYDADGNMTKDNSKDMSIAYDWRGMPVEFKRFRCTTKGSTVCDSVKLVMAYDGSGRRVSKTRMRKAEGGDWEIELVTHYTGIGTEVREYMPWNFVRFTDSQGVEHCISANPDYAGTASTTCPLPDTVRVVVPLPNGLGRHALQNAAYEEPLLQGAYEFYLKDHLGSARVVYGVGFPDPLGISPNGVFRAAYDYRSFGEQLDLFVFSRKVTENFTGKELDDETELNYFGARYLDPMLGMWISVDPKRFFPSPYLYMGNGYNPIRFADLNGMAPYELYGSLDAAAQDFAKLYNGLSIASNKEYGTVFYRKGDFYSYVNPTRGGMNSVNLSACVFEARTKGYQIVSSGHTHGRLTDEYGAKQDGFLEPSYDDYISEFSDENYTPYKENPLDPAYVVVPNGNLLKYGLDDVDVVPTEGIASDPVYQYDVDLLSEP